MMNDTVDVVLITNDEFDAIGSERDDWDLDVIDYDEMEAPIPADAWNLMDEAVERILSDSKLNEYLPIPADAWTMVIGVERSFIRIFWDVCGPDGRIVPGHLVDTDEELIFTYELI